MLRYKRIEYAAVVEVVTRLALVLVLATNYEKARWYIAQWTPELTASLLAAAIELVLFAATMIVTDRRVWNATKRKSDPARPLLVVLLALCFFGFLSGWANYGYLLVHGSDATNALLYGAAAPLIAGFVAYLFGEEAAIQQRQSEHDGALKARTEQRKANRAARKAEPEQVEATASEFVCPSCKVDFGSKARLNGHGPTRCAAKLTAARRGENHRETERVKED